MFWTLYILVSVAGTTEQTFIGVESFETRVNCESKIDSKVIFKDYKMNKLFLIIIPLLFLEGCASVNNEVGGLFFPDSPGGPDTEYYEYVGYDEFSGYDVYELLDRYEDKYKYTHKAVLVSLSEGRSGDARDIMKTLNTQEYNQLLQKYAKKEAASKAEKERQRQIRLAEQERQRAEQERQREIRLAEQERQRQIRLANQKRAEEERREKILKMQPVICDEMVTALNENEVRAIRLYPLNKEYRVAGIATDINVTFGDAVVSIKSDVDFFNGCSAEITSFDEAETINKGDSIDLFCSSWRETAGNVIFKKCQLFSQMFKN